MPNPATGQKPPSKLSQITFLKTFHLAAEFGFIIALPLIVFGYAGKYLAAKYHSKLFLLAAIVLALACSISWLYFKIGQIIKELKNK